MRKVRQEPKFVRDAQERARNTQIKHGIKSKESLQARIKLHQALAKHARQQLKTAKATDIKLLENQISSNERQSILIEKHLERKK